MGTSFMGFGNRMAGCFSFRKQRRAVNKAGQKTFTRLTPEERSESVQRLRALMKGRVNFEAYLREKHKDNHPCSY